jgi:ADP-ribose pyrophosphatase YjhB (NUDIX family)
MKIEYSAGGVVVNDSRVLLVFQKATQAWSLPKGHIENLETEEAAARREILEESGLKNIELIRFLGRYERSTKRDIHVRKSISIFLFSTNQNKAVPICDDVSSCKWVSISDVSATLTYIEDSTFFSAQIAIIQSMLEG